MRMLRCVIALFTGLAAVTACRAQGIVIMGPRGWDDFGSARPRQLHIVYLSGSPYRSSCAGPPCAFPITRIGFFQPVLPVLVGPPPWTGVPFGRQGLPFDPDLDNAVALLRPPRSAPPPPPLVVPIDPGEPASVFRPILPEDRLRALPPDQAPPAAPAKKLPPAPAPKPKAPKLEPKPLPGPRLPDVNPKTENARQLRLGREAFASREFGRSERRFQEGAQALPQDSHAYFLLAQAQLALGKYEEAVASIHNGMRHQPTWPTALFWPRDLYESNFESYDEHLRSLAAAVKRFPDDATLLFLYGYQLWFDDRRDEARPLLKQAAGRAADPTFTRRFVPAQP